MSSTSIRSQASRRPLSVWELPKLATLVHSYRKTKRPAKTMRPHFAAILAFVYRNRLVVAEQVRRRFPKFLRSDRTARRHLAEMESQGLLGVQPATNVSPLMPKPYFVTRLGLQYLRKSFAERGKAWEPFVADRKRAFGQSFQHVWHELATTEFLLSVWEAVERRPDLELLKLERRSLVKHPSFRVPSAARLTHVQPDGLFLFRQRGGGMMSCLLETHTGTQTPGQIAEKLQRYHAWAASQAARQFLCDLYAQHGARRPTSAFRLLFACCGNVAADDLSRMQALYRIVCGQPDDLRQRIWLTSGDHLRRYKGEPSLMEQPIWIHCAGGPGDSLPSPDRLPLHSLFPPARPT